MLFVIGLVVVVGSVLGGYLPHGDIRVLWQPLEVLIILGAAIGGFIIANPGSVQRGVVRNLKVLLKGAPYPKAAYLELLTLLYAVFKLAKTKGTLALEAHLEHPYESELFQRFPTFLANHHAVEFLCDYLRLITLGAENPHEIEELMAADLETHHAEREQIAAALAGTFMGVLFAYGFVGPMAGKLRAYFEAEAKYYECLKAGLVAFVQGHAPAIAVEFARKTLYSHERPSFTEVEEAVANAPAAG